MTVDRLDAEAVLQDDRVSERALLAHEANLAIRRGNDRSSVPACDIHATVELPVAGEG